MAWAVGAARAEALVDIFQPCASLSPWSLSTTYRPPSCEPSRGAQMVVLDEPQVVVVARVHLHHHDQGVVLAVPSAPLGQIALPLGPCLCLAAVQGSRLETSLQALSRHGIACSLKRSHHYSHHFRWAEAQIRFQVQHDYAQETHPCGLYLFVRNFSCAF